MILISYTCRCLVDHVDVPVRDRASGEDIADWMANVVIEQLAIDHRKRSPTCTSDRLDEVRIPMPENAPFIGGKPRLDA